MKKVKGQIITDIEFVSDLRCFTKGEKYNFQPGINLLVGDQGCGKSTLISSLVDCNEEIKVNVTRESDYTFFDTENHNPRMVKNLSSTFHNGANVLCSFFESHGETLLPFLTGLKKFKNRLIFLDEPEAGLSIRSQYKVAELLLHLAAKNGNQLFIATHSPIFMETVNDVLSLEHKKWMLTKDFINTQK